MATDLIPVPLPCRCFKVQTVWTRSSESRYQSSGVDSRRTLYKVNKYKLANMMIKRARFGPTSTMLFSSAMRSIPNQKSYGYIEADKRSILHPNLKTIPRVPQVELIGKGWFTIMKASWKLNSHIALYNLSPPRVTTLYALSVPQGPKQICRYDDGSGDELPVPLSTTAFVSGKTTFDILPKELKSVAVRSKVEYAHHPYVWISPAKAKSIGIGIECDGLRC
ncbi:hypothetical protein K435DRAFT_790938 [Dendrothele bispora CBS 962.96]|uniref:Uncharacterized protein n=1 Tax=Dendrothele bispora (strain CBS 962.96) TaxID=1314807 RepID=A0A4S8MQH9_DENBC|nr:hypothetical protein K435DRAFT_790938 [Dendrothele bispora CBS 962.96]